MIRSSKRHRRALATMEAVLAAGIAVPIAATLLFLGVRICVFLYRVIAVQVGWAAF